MGHRLSKIYTRTGDTGTTGLGDGDRVSKSSDRIQAIGDVDELNSVIGILLTNALPDETENVLIAIQHDLFDLGGELSIPGATVLKPDSIDLLEATIDRLNASLPPLKEFILPGGSPAAAHCHLARAICRRAERRLVALMTAEEVGEAALRYLNRLSDLLFVMARTLARQDGGTEVLWDRARVKPDPAKR